MAQFENGVIVRHSPLGHTEFSATSTPQGLPSLPSKLDSIRRVLITPRAHGIIWTDDGTAPSPTHGQPLSADSTLVYDGTKPETIQIVRDGSSDVDVRVAYHGL